MAILIRADGGPDIGYGHLRRTGALAASLLEEGMEVTYTTATPDAVAEICPGSVNIRPLQDRTTVDPVLNIVRQGVEAVVLDSYVAGTDYQSAVRELVTLCLLSDNSRSPVCADIVVNGNLYAQSLDYEFLAEEPIWCLGPDYLLIREELSQLTRQKASWRIRPKRAIVTLGGSDMAGLTPTVLRAFDGQDLQIDAIIGPGFSERQEREICTVAGQVSCDVRVARNPDDLPERMFEADLAVTTASTTTYELLALGIPIVTCAVVDNQKPIAAELRDRDLATVVDHSDGVTVFARAVEEYVTDSHLRRRRSEKGREIVDGCGVDRVAEVLKAHTNR